MTKCPYCGRELIEDELYCFFCDQDVSKKQRREEKTKKTIKPAEKPKTFPAYCVKCRSKVNGINPKRYIMKNKRIAVKGVCPHCTTKVFRILGMEK